MPAIQQKSLQGESMAPATDPARDAIPKIRRYSQDACRRDSPVPRPFDIPQAVILHHRPRLVERFQYMDLPTGQTPVRRQMPKFHPFRLSFWQHRASMVVHNHQLGRILFQPEIMKHYRKRKFMKLAFSIKGPPLSLPLPDPHPQALHVGPACRCGQQCHKKPAMTEKERQSLPGKIPEMMHRHQTQYAKHPCIRQDERPERKHLPQASCTGRTREIRQLPDQTHQQRQ